MGGAIALRSAISLGADVRGLVLIAPMLAPAAGPAAHMALTALAWTPLARVALIPSSATDNSKQYADPAVLAEVEVDTLAYKGALRVCSVSTVLDLGYRCEESLDAVTCPFFCLTAKKEQVLTPAARLAAERLFEVAGTPKKQRRLQAYDTLHGMLCEPLAVREVIIEDIVGWMRDDAITP
jgi:acylglycerol lipase